MFQAIDVERCAVNIGFYWGDHRADDLAQACFRCCNGWHLCGCGLAMIDNDDFHERIGASVEGLKRAGLVPKSISVNGKKMKDDQ